MSRRALRRARFERPQRRSRGRAQETTPEPVASSSHTFGALKFVSDSNKARIYVATFSSLTQEGLHIIAQDSVTGGITIPKTKSAIVDCAVEGAAPGGADFIMQVQHAGGPTATHTMENGAQRLVFGLTRTIGLETFTLKNVGSPYALWTLGQCEVSFQ